MDITAGKFTGKAEIISDSGVLIDLNDDIFVTVNKTNDGSLFEFEETNVAESDMDSDGHSGQIAGKEGFAVIVSDFDKKHEHKNQPFEDMP